MQVSRYVKLVHKENQYLVYNTLSNCLYSVDKQLYEYLSTKIAGNKSVKKSEIASETYNSFRHNLIITENDDDDFLIYESTLQSRRKIHDTLLLTIAPTMDCNFHCPYCFEQKVKGTMRSETSDNVINWISQYPNISNIRITWFGGEPLLAPDVIQYFTEKLKEKTQATLEKNSIITNGYFLTEENIQMLEKCGINSIQVSMDGIFEKHNCKRYTKTDKKTFETILSNIDTFDRLRLDMYLTIRIGVDKDNKNDYYEAQEFFRNRYANKKISVVPAFIIETTKSCMESCISDEQEKLEFYKVLSKKTSSKDFIYPSNNVEECAIRNFNSWVIDSKGDVYKCWEIIGNEKYKVGHIDANGMHISNQKILNRYLYGADPLEETKCRECQLLPICSGGCPHKRIENKFNHKHFNVCTRFLDCLDDYLLLRNELSNR